jgi:hypothetical protein
LAGEQRKTTTRTHEAEEEEEMNPNPAEFNQSEELAHFADPGHELYGLSERVIFYLVETCHAIEAFSEPSFTIEPVYGPPGPPGTTPAGCFVEFVVHQAFWIDTSSTRVRLWTSSGDDAEARSVLLSTLPSLCVVAECAQKALRLSWAGVALIWESMPSLPEPSGGFIAPGVLRPQPVSHAEASRRGGKSKTPAKLQASLLNLQKAIAARRVRRKL